MAEAKRMVDFKKVKEEVGFALVLDKLGLLDGMNLEGDELVGFCPLHEGVKKKPTFYANEKKGVFQCFSCKNRGNVLDFVASFQGVGIRKAGMWLEDLMNEREGETETAEPKVDPEDDGLEEKLEEVFLLLISRVEKHLENKEILAKKLSGWVCGQLK